MRSPNFFIVGAAKSGTTAMHHFLSQHPLIFMSDHKEPHFFGADLEWHGRRPLTEPQYLRLFEQSGSLPIVGESSVFYVYSRDAAREIHAYSPDSKILIMLRNPVDMIYSFHSQRVFNGTEDITDFETALAAEEERREGRRLPHHVGLRQGLYYRDLGKFSEQVRRFLDAFTEDRVLVLLYDDFKADPSNAYRTALEFLGLEHGFSPDFSIINPNTVNRSARLQHWIAAPPPGLRRLARMVLPTTKRRYRLGNALLTMNTRVEPRRPMPAQLRHRLQDEFAADIARLEHLLGRDLTAWKRRDPEASAIER